MARRDFAQQPLPERARTRFRSCTYCTYKPSCAMSCTRDETIVWGKHSRLWITPRSDHERSASRSPKSSSVATSTLPTTQILSGKHATDHTDRTHLTDPSWQTRSPVDPGEYVELGSTYPNIYTNMYGFVRNRLFSCFHLNRPYISGQSDTQTSEIEIWKCQGSYQCGA